MRHVDHDAVEARGDVCCLADYFGCLGVVQVHGYRDGGVACGFGGGVHEDRSGVVQGPGEEEDHGGGAELFGGADGCEDAFEVVAAHGGDAVVVLVGVVQDGEGAVVG